MCTLCMLTLCEIDGERKSCANRDNVELHKIICNELFFIKKTKIINQDFKMCRLQNKLCKAQHNYYNVAQLSKCKTFVPLIHVSPFRANNTQIIQFLKCTCTQKIFFDM